MKSQLSDRGDKKVGHDAVRACGESMWKAPRGKQHLGVPQVHTAMQHWGPSRQGPGKKGPSEHLERGTRSKAGVLRIRWGSRVGSEGEPRIEAMKGGLLADAGNEG